MSRKHFSWLLIATIAVAVLVLIIPGRTGRESSFEHTELVPGLAEQVNDINWVRLTGAGNEIIATLRRENLAWVVGEASGYRAEWSRVKTLLASLSRAEVLEEKTSNPGYYARLGVEDVGADDAGGVMVEFAPDSGLPAVIIGNGAQGRNGQYARLRDSGTSVLINTRIDVPADQIDWLDKTIVDVADAEVIEYEIIHPDGESIKAKKVSADDEDFELQNVPEGREIKSAWTVDEPANALAALDFQAVAPATQLDWDGAVRFRILTTDGLQLESELMAVPGGEGEEGQAEHWLRLEAGVYTTAVEMADDGNGEDSAALARAQEINGRAGGWAYRIPAYRSDTMTRRLENMLKQAEEDNEPPPL